MKTRLQVNQQTIQIEEILPLLQEYQLLPQLVREILIDRAIAPIVCTSEEIMQARETFYSQRQLTSETARQKWHAESQMTEEEVKRIIIRGLKIGKFKEAIWDDEVESYFLKRKPLLDRYVYSLLRVKEMGIAQELYFRLHLGEQSFPELARKYSQGSERYTMGIIGPVTLDVPKPALAKILVRSQKGVLVEPTLLGEWVAIVRVEEIIPAQFDLAMRKKLLDELFQIWLKEQLKMANYVLKQ